GRACSAAGGRGRVRCCAVAVVRCAPVWRLDTGAERRSAWRACGGAGGAVCGGVWWQLCAVLRCGGSTPVLSAEVQRSWAVGGWLRVGKWPRAGAGGRAQRSELLPDCGSCGRCSSEGFPEEGACGDWPSAGSDGSIEPASPNDREPCGRGAPEVSSCS